MRKREKNGRQWTWPMGLLPSIVAFGLWAGAAGAGAQSSPNQGSPNEAPGAQSQTQTPPQPAQDIPDAPTPQPSQPEPERPPIAKPEEKPPASPARNPWTNAPETKPAGPAADENQPAPPPMPPVKTLPPGSSTKDQAAQAQLYKLLVVSNFVQVPVTVKDRDGRLVDGLLDKDFVVMENGTRQKLTFFTSDPFALSVAVVLDLGMPDSAVQKVNATFPALVGAFAPYDEVSLYTYSSTVSQVSDFAGVTQKLTALLNQMKTERGHNNGVPVLSGPMASGPIVNGIPVGTPTQPVNTPPKEAHVLNEAILQAALDLSKRDRTRRKIIFVISDGREFGSKASYSDVLKVLLSNEIQVKAVAVEAAALPLYSKLERLHIPDQGYGNLLPKYTSATGGAVYNELSRNAIEEIYSQAMSEARNQYTLGYTPRRGEKPSTSPYHSIEVLVNRPGLKIYAKDGYYPAPAAR
ncbi:MAG: VWA domain-containing protein [Candidatus Sulfotelmatobacter sp.]